MNSYNYDSSCPQFNGVKEPIDLSKFPQASEMRGAKHSGYGILHLDTVTDESLQQCYTRDEISEERVNDTQDSYDVNNFVTDVEPPKIDTDGNILEGRGRIKAAILNKEKYIPVSIYKMSDTTKGNRLKVGLDENNPNIANSKVPNDMDSWALTIRGLVLLGPEEGGINDSTVEVTNQLNELNWEKRWPRQASRTTLRKKIDKELRAYRNGESMVIRRIDNDVKSWLRENYTNSDGIIRPHVLVCADHERYVRQLICGPVLKAVKVGKDPVPIILYTKSRTSGDAIKNVKKFNLDLDNLYIDIFEHVGVMQLRDPEIAKWLKQFKDPPVFKKMPKERPYKIIGAIPQVQGYHAINGNKLVMISDYDTKKNGGMR